jgi:hypothetical protein
MDDALTGLIDIEKPNAAGGSLDPKCRQQLLPDFARTSTTARGRDGVVWRSEGQFRTVDLKAAPFDIKQSARAAEVVQQVTVDVKKISVIAQASNDVLVPDLGQHGTAGLSQGSPPFGFLRPAALAANRRFCTTCGLR